MVESVDDICPYPGLVAYDVGNAAAFFGRRADAEACLARLHRTGVVAVVGPSGSGKTSLVRAGIVPVLLIEGYAVRLTTPGGGPRAELLPERSWPAGPRRDTGVATPGDGAAPDCLVVDQLEDALAPGSDPYERAAYFAALTAAAERGLLVLAVDAEYIGALTADPQAARLIERGLHLLGPLGRENLADAIEGPAARVGLHFESGLVDLLHHDVDRSASGLPLLAHALRRLWDERDGRALTVAAYRRIGGVQHAVAGSGESVYEETAEDHRPLLRELLLRLVEPTVLGDARRVRLPYRLAAFGPVRARLVERLLVGRLLVRTDDDVELAHDALLTAWPRLRSWIDDDLDGLRVRRHLAVAAEDWQRLGRPASELYRGVRLTRAVEWNQRHRPSMSPDERAFLGASEKRAAMERREAEDRLREQTATSRRLRALAGALVTLLVVALIAGGLAGRHAARADRAAAVADARRIGAQALATPVVDRALLLAVQAARLDESAETRATLLQTIARRPFLVGAARTNRPLSAVAVSPDERLVAVGAATGGLIIYDAGTMERRLSVPVPVTRAAFDPDGTTIAVVTGEVTRRDEPDPVAPVVLVDARSGAVRPLGGDVPAAPAVEVAYVNGGREIVATFADGVARRSPESTLVVWDTEAGTERRVVVPGVSPSLAVDETAGRAFVGTSRTGRRGWLSVVDLASGAVLQQSAVTARPVAVSPDGAVLAGVDGEHAVLFDTTTLAEVLRLETHRQLVPTGSFTSDGRRFVTASSDGRATVWNVRPSLGPLPERGPDQRRVAELHGHAGAVVNAVVGPETATVYTVSPDELLLVWDLAGERRLVARDRSAAEDPPPAPALRRTDQGIEVYAPGTQLPVRAPVPFTGSIRAMFSSADWERAAVLTTDRNIAIVDFSRSVIIGSLKVAWTPVSASFSADRSHVAVTGANGEVGLMELDDVEWVAPPSLAHGGEIRSVAWAPDGRSFVTGGNDGRIGLWDGASGARLGLLEVGARSGAVAARFDGHDVVVEDGAGPAFRFDTRVSAWMAFACAVAGRNLTAEEWADSFGDAPYRETCPSG